MVIKIVTDSTCDLPDDLLKELDITVVAEYLSFGEKIYRDQVDIQQDEFYEKLVSGSVYPKTAQPTPQDFADVYTRLSATTDAIVSLHLSTKLSGTCNSALQGKKLVNTACRIEIVDSRLVSVALGLVVMQAAKMAQAGMSLEQIMAGISTSIANVHFLIYFDTLKYLAKGGRIGKAKALVGALLNIKPLLMLKDGELVPTLQVRTRAKGTAILEDFARKASSIEDLAVLYSTTPDAARDLVDRLAPLFPKERIILSRLGSALGVHGGPGVLAIAFREKP